jgi:hypothetical protein
MVLLGWLIEFRCSGRHKQRQGRRSYHLRQRVLYLGRSGQLLNEQGGYADLRECRRLHGEGDWLRARDEPTDWNHHKVLSYFRLCF